MSEHSQIVSWTIDLQGEPYVLSFWALKFSPAGGPGYWVEREETTPPRYYLHSLKFDGLRDTDIYTEGAEAVGWMNGVMAVWDQPRPAMMGLPIRICADGSRIPMTRVEASSPMPREALGAIGGSDRNRRPEIPAANWVSLADGNPALARALGYFGQPDDWHRFYQLCEVIEDIHGSDVKYWVSKKQFDKLIRTANSYRHANAPPVDNPLRLPEARYCLRTIMRCWLRKLYESGGSGG